MRYCDACGDRAVATCPHCHADTCAECIPICEHDHRQAKTSAPATAKEAEQDKRDYYAGDSLR